MLSTLYVADTSVGVLETLFQVQMAVGFVRGYLWKVARKARSCLLNKMYHMPSWFSGSIYSHKAKIQSPRQELS